MSNEKKTLADVQPGGRVRLGDALPPLPPEIDPVRCMIRGEGVMAEACDYYYTAEQMRDYARAALSAQPSPAGQGGLNYERMFVDACAALAEVSRELGCDPEQGGAEPILAAIAELREALAARQPVDENYEVWAQNAENVAAELTDERAIKALRFAARGIRSAARHQVRIYGCCAQPEGELHTAECPNLRHLAARQPVGEPVAEVVEIGGVKRLRVYPDAGLHALLQFPVGTRYFTAPPAQAVDLGQFRQPVQDWLDDAQASMEEHGDYDGVFGYAIEEGTRLLALIDSQAVQS
ncbi:hypothetical protein I5U42_06950 [Stenotrophomonas maltophilia]|nr:hypothetical protein [Stenotrophomonas maltophilia]